MVFHRLALSKDKDGVLKLARVGNQPEIGEDLIREPYILEFLGIPEQHHYTEREIETRIIDNLQSFLLELGKALLSSAGSIGLRLATRTITPTLCFIIAY